MGAPETAGSCLCTKIDKHAPFGRSCPGSITGSFPRWTRQFASSLRTHIGGICPHSTHASRTLCPAFVTTLTCRLIETRRSGKGDCTGGGGGGDGDCTTSVVWTEDGCSGHSGSSVSDNSSITTGFFSFFSSLRSFVFWVWLSLAAVSSSSLPLTCQASLLLSSSMLLLCKRRRFPMFSLHLSAGGGGSCSSVCFF